MLKKIWIFHILVFCLLPVNPVLASDNRIMDLRAASYQSNLLQAVGKSLDLDNAAAIVYLKKAMELEPDNPTGYALEAMIHLFAYEMCFTPDQRQKEKEAIFHYSREALIRGEKRIAKDSKESQAYLSLAVAKIAKVHWAIQEKRYFVMAQETLNIWNYLEAAKAADPADADVDYLMGLLRYHIDRYTGVTGFVSSLLITEGDRKKGLQEMQSAAQKGHLLREMAQIQLASIYLTYEKQPSQALPIILELRKKFPNNYVLHFMHSLALMELGRFAEAEIMAFQIVEKIKAGIPPYARELQPRYYQLMGLIYQKKRDHNLARLFLFKAMEDKSFYNIRTVARSFLYLGMIADDRQERKSAREYYMRVLKMEGADEGARIEARKYLKAPYQANGN